MPQIQSPVVAARRANVVTKTANYTAVDGDVVLVNAAGGAVTITIPVASGTQVTVKRIDSATTNVIVVGSSGLVDGDANATLAGLEAAATFVGDGTNLEVVSINGATVAQSAGVFVNAFVASMVAGTTYLADPSGSGFNMNLPGSPVAGQRWKVAKYDTGLNAVGIVFPFGSTTYYQGSLVTSLTLGLNFPGDTVEIFYDGTHFIAVPETSAQPYQTWTPVLVQNGSVVAKAVNFARWNRIGGRIHAYCQLTASAAGAIGIITISMAVQPTNNAQPLNGQFWWLSGAHYSGFPSVFGSLGSYTVIGIGSAPATPTSTAMGAGLPSRAISIGDTFGYSIIYEG